MNEKPATSSERVGKLISAAFLKPNKRSLSDTFIDAGYQPQERGAQQEAKPSSTATLSELESAFAAPGSQSLSVQTGLLRSYACEFLGDKTSFRELLDELTKGDDCGQQSAYLDDKQLREFLSLQPALDKLEREEFERKAVAGLPQAARGLAMYSLVSAFRYAACLELVFNVIRGTAPVDAAGYSLEIVEVPRLGKIRDWQFDSVERSGSLFVEDMKVDRYRFRYDGDAGVVVAKLVEQWSYDWHISVAEGGYTLATRVSMQDFLALLEVDPNADPFVDVLPQSSTDRPALPAEAKDFLNPDSIWGRGLTGRLFASGESVRVLSVTGTRYQMVPVDEATAVADTSTIYEAIDGTQYHRASVIEGNVVFGPNCALLEPSQDACIDIMFALPESGDFPATIAEFPASQTGWCLGRCRQPLIANSR